MCKHLYGRDQGQSIVIYWQGRSFTDFDLKYQNKYRNITYFDLKDQNKYRNITYFDF